MRAQATQLLDEAEKLAKTEKQKTRLAHVRELWRYVELTLGAMSAVDKLDEEVRARPSNPDRQIVLATRDAINARYDYMDKAQHAKLGHIRKAEEGNTRTIPFLPALGRIQLLLSGKKPVADARAISADPPTPEQWAAAAAFTPFLENFAGKEVKAATTAKALYNGRALFIRVECDEPDMAKLPTGGVTQRDGPVWQEHEIEIFLDPDNARKQYVHFIANCIGTQFDAKCAGGQPPDIAWNADWKVRITRGEKAWSAEFEIPFASRGQPPPLKGDIWGLNVCRVRPSTREYSAWSPTFGLFHNPLQFGQVVFK